MSEEKTIAAVYWNFHKAGKALLKVKANNTHSGNLSIRDPKDHDRFFITASGSQIDALGPRDIVPIFFAHRLPSISKGAIADVEAIILWPDGRESRTMSLVPPFHFVLLKADAIYSNLSESLKKKTGRQGCLLVSGPSKTADIELRLAFVVHAPKELLVLIV